MLRRFDSYIADQFGVWHSCDMRGVVNELAVNGTKLLNMRLLLKIPPTLKQEIRYLHTTTYLNYMP